MRGPPLHSHALASLHGLSETGTFLERNQNETRAARLQNRVRDQHEKGGDDQTKEVQTIRQSGTQKGPPHSCLITQPTASRLALAAPTTGKRSVRRYPFPRPAIRFWDPGEKWGDVSADAVSYVHGPAWGVLAKVPPSLSAIIKFEGLVAHRRPKYQANTVKSFLLRFLAVFTLLVNTVCQHHFCSVESSI